MNPLDVDAIIDAVLAEADEPPRDARPATWSGDAINDLLRGSPADEPRLREDVPPRARHAPKTDPTPSPAVRWWPGPELMGAVFPEPTWVVPGLVPEGVTLLVGAPKLGKSWLALGLALAVASGGAALGSIPVEKGKAAVLALEDTPRRLQSRAKLLLGDQPMPDGLGVAFEVPRLGEGLAEALDKLDTGSLRLAVVDVLARVRPAAARADSVYDRDYAAMAALKAWSDRHRVPTLVVHHTRKAGAEDFLDSVSGSHGLAGGADTVLVMRRARNSADAVLLVVGRDVEEAEHALKFDPSRGLWILLDGPAADYDLGDTRRRVRDLLRERGKMRAKEISVELGVEHDAARQIVRRMAGDGQLDTDGAGLYFVPTDPLSHLSHDLPPDPLTSENGHDPSDTPTLTSCHTVTRGTASDDGHDPSDTLSPDPVTPPQAADQRKHHPSDSCDSCDSPGDSPHGGPAPASPPPRLDASREAQPPDLDFEAATRLVLAAFPGAEILPPGDA